MEFYNKNKKAAMFGLDARIALAIFGALSVITGAALYSAINNAKATALLTEMQEVGKAWEAYYLDTGQNLPRKSELDSQNEFYALNVVRLVEKDKEKNWKGPYIKYKVDTNRLVHPQFGGIYMQTLTNENTWGDDVHWNNATKGGKCLSGKSCFVWVEFCSIKTDSTAKIIDKKYDSGTGPKDGNFRWYYNVDGVNHCYYNKIAPIKNPHG